MCRSNPLKGAQNIEHRAQAKRTRTIAAPGTVNRKKQRGKSQELGCRKSKKATPTKSELGHATMVINNGKRDPLHIQTETERCITGCKIHQQPCAPSGCLLPKLLWPNPAVVAASTAARRTQTPCLATLRVNTHQHSQDQCSSPNP